MAQWLRFGAYNAGGPALIPGQGIRFRMPQLGVHMPQLRPHSAAKETDNCLNCQPRNRLAMIFSKNTLEE